MNHPTYYQHEDIENLNNYRPGGFHPVLLGDSFQDGRYIVVHKLGYGSYATVWLVKDTQRNRCVALKILAANAPHASSEIAVVRRLRALAASASGSQPGMEIF